MVQGQYPIISTGLGKLTPDVWKRIMDMLRVYEQHNRDERARGEDARGQTTVSYFLAWIGDSEQLPAAQTRPYRFRYGWEEVELTGDTFDTKTGGRSGESDDEITGALNLCEATNTDANVSPAVDLLGVNYPTGFEMRAIGNCFDGTQLKTVVMMFEIYDVVDPKEDSEKRWVFSLANAHDGTCT